MKKIVIVVVTAVVVIISATMWLHKPVKQSMPQVEQKTLRVGLVPWIGDGVYYVAQAKGFFEKEKVKVELVPIDDTATGKQLLQTGKIDILYLSPETVAVLHDAGVKIKILGAQDISFGADGIVASNNIKTVEDLKGKTVAFEVGSPSHFLISYLLNEKGLTTNNLTVVNNVAPDAGVAFVAGKVDAAVTWEPWLTQASQRAGGHLLVSSKDAPVLYDIPIIREEVVSQYPQDVKGLLRGVFASQEWIAAHQTEAADLIAKELKITPKEATDQMQGVHWFSYAESVDHLTNGQYSVQNAIQTAADLWLKLGLIKNHMNAGDIVDGSVLKNLYHETTSQN